MKLHERINCILLGTLWCLAIVLALDFWLNTVYNFNIFSNTHWTYVANAQATNQQIATGFYIAITIAITSGILGLYMLFRPRFRKIIIKKPEPEKNITAPIPTIPETQPTQQNTTEKTPTIQRPPHLHIQINSQNNLPNRQTKTHNTTTTTQQKTQTPEPRYTHEIRDIFEKNGYTVLSQTNIANTQLSVIALGTDETLWLGTCDISHEQMTDVMLALQSTFQETLEDIDIDINAFIINPIDNNKVDAILDIETLDDLATIIDETPNIPESDADIESDSMNAFRGYIETVITYLGKKQ